MPTATLTLPDPRPLARALRPLLLQAAMAARAGRPLSPYLTPLAQTAAPLLARWTDTGYQRTRRRLLLRLPRRKSLQWAFDLFRPSVAVAAENAALDLAQSTLDTIQGDVGRALARIRSGLAAGLREGETTQQLSARVAAVVASPERAFRIATTEASRAVHAGQVLAAKDTMAETGLTIRKRWLASSDACDACLRLGGTIVDIDASFGVGNGSGVYAVVYHPPLHPHCMCSMTEVIA